MKTELDLSWCDFSGNKKQKTRSTKLNRLKSISDEKLSTICHPTKASPLYNSLPPLPDLIPIKRNLNLINYNYNNNSVSDNSNNNNNKSRSCSNLDLSRKNHSSCNNINNNSNSSDDVCTISRNDEYRNCSNSMSPKHCYNEWKPPSGAQHPKLQPNNILITNDDEKYCNMLSKHNNNNNSNCDNKNENINNCSNNNNISNSKSNNRTIRQQKSRHKRRHSLTTANKINNNNNNDSTPNKTTGNECANEAKSRINPIFLWVKQNDSHIIEVKCEDYDHRNRIRLTKTSSGWKAIPRTEQNSSLSTNSSLESSNSSSGNSCKKNKKKKKKHKKKNKHHHRRKSTVDEEDEDGRQSPQKETLEPKERHLIPHKPLLEPVEMKVELTRIKLDEIEGYDDVDEEEEEPQIIEKAAELVVAVPEHVPEEEEDEDDDEDEHSVTVIPPEDEDDEDDEEDIEEVEDVEEIEDVEEVEVVEEVDVVEEVEDVDEVEEVEEVEEHHYNNIINDSTKELMDGIRNMENITANTIEVDLLDDDDDDHNESTINGSELIDSLVKQGCEEHNIISSEEDELKNHMDDYNDDDDILLTEEPVVSDIISRLNDSLSSPKCLSFNEAGEIEGISDVFNTHSTSSLDHLSITISEFHNDKSNKNVLDNSSNKIVSPDSCQQDQFHPKDLRICKTNNSSNNISVNSNNSGNVSDNNSISKKNLESPDLSITLISRPISRSSDTIQSPQPSGIPAVPPSPDLLFHNKNNFINLNHQFKLPTQKSIQKEPLDLGTSIYRKSASPTVSCSQEAERISIESCSPKRIKMEHKSLEKVIENLRSPSQNSMSSISTMTPTPTPSHHNTSANNIIDLVDMDDDDDNNNHSISNNTSKNTNSSSGHFINRNNSDPDPLTQLRLLVSNPEWKVPDPLLVPKDRLNAILESPAREIPLLLTTRPELRLPEAFSFPNILQDPDIMVVSLSQLEMILVKQDELLKAANVVPTTPPVVNNKQQPQQQQHVPEILDKPTNNCSSLKYNSSSNNISSRDSSGKNHVKSKSNSQSQQQQAAAAAAAAAVAAAIAPTTNLLPNSLASEIDAATMAAFNQMFWLPYPAGQLNPADLLKIPDINQFNTNFPYQNLPTSNQNNNNNNSNNSFNGCPPDLSAMLQEAARQMSNNYFLQALKLSQSRWNNNSSSNQNLQQNNNNNNHSNSNNVTNIKKRPQNMLPQEFIHPQLNHHNNNGNYPPTSPRNTNTSNNHNNNNNNNNINWNINPNHNYSKLQQSSRSSSSSSSTTTTHNPFASPPYYQDSPQSVFNHHHHLLAQPAIQPQHQSTPKIKQQKMSSHHHPHSNHHHQNNNSNNNNNNQYNHHNLSANLNHLISSHKTDKPRVTCKSLLNLLQPNQSAQSSMQHHPHLQRFNSTGSNESISSEIDMQLHHNMMNSNSNNHNNNNNNSSNNNNHSQAKLKVKPGSHLLDPAAAQRKLLNDDITDVVSTTSGIEDVLNDPNMSLWHPLFGNTQNGNYTSPWHWTTVTATGE